MRTWLSSGNPFFCYLAYPPSFLFFVCRNVCGFFMLQILQSYDGNSLVDFDQRDIINIRRTLIYSWLTAGGFDIDMKVVLGIDPGMKFCLLCLCELQAAFFLTI
jgi:hypothetical protein